MSRMRTGAVELETLEHEHQELEKQLQRLERRPHLTPDEQAEAAALKRAKLLRKDAIQALRSSN